MIIVECLEVEDLIFFFLYMGLFPFGVCERERVRFWSIRRGSCTIWTTAKGLMISSRLKQQKQSLTNQNPNSMKNSYNFMFVCVLREGQGVRVPDKYAQGDLECTPQCYAVNLRTLCPQLFFFFFLVGPMVKTPIGFG